MSGVFTLVLPFCFLLSACDQFSNSDAALNRRLNDSESELTKAESKLTKAEIDVATLQREVAALRQKQEFDDLIKDWDKVAYLTPGARGYSTVGFDLGVLTVKLEDVKPYANGSKVTLRFGNVLSSAINGVTATIDWGKVNEKGIADDSSAKSKEMTFNQTLPAGAWTSISIVLDGIPPAELGFVRVSKVHHSGIRLAR
jgi:hypothetical protein